MIGVLALCALSIPIWRMRPAVDFDRRRQVQVDLQSFRTVLEMYKGMNGSYPTTEQGLHALVEKSRTSPKPRQWHRVDMNFPKDPWQNDYVYRCPGAKIQMRYDLFSSGPDHTPDTADDDWGY